MAVEIELGCATRAQRNPTPIPIHFDVVLKRNLSQVISFFLKYIHTFYICIYHYRWLDSSVPFPIPFWPVSLHSA